MLQLLEHICAWDRSGGSLRVFKCVNSSLSPRPFRLILPLGDKSGIQAWWQVCQLETDAVTAIAECWPGLRPVGAYKTIFLEQDRQKTIILL